MRGPLNTLSYPATWLEGIKLHRRVDAYTDQHPVVIQSRNRISPKRRRYAGIIVDLAYDHFLASHWQNYHPRNLNAFKKICYRELATQRPALPDTCQWLIPHLINGDWLASYQAIKGVSSALNGIARRYEKRFQRLTPLENSAEEIEAQWDGLYADFREFMPQLLNYCHHQISNKGSVTD